MTEKENTFYNALLYNLFLEAADDLGKETDEQRQEELSAMAHFSAITGAREKSPLYMMYCGFRMGVAKGLCLSEKMEKAAGS